MDHHPVAYINPHMGHWPRAVIGSREKDNVPRFGFGGRDNRALIVNALRGEQSTIRKYTRQAEVIRDPDIVEILNRIILDERHHVELFRTMLDQLP